MRLVSLALVLLLSACTMPPTKGDLASADYGTALIEQDAQAIAQAFLNSYLKDPESAVIEWKAFKKSWLREGLIHGGSVNYGYRLDARIKAKNSFGAYTGYKQYMFMLKNRKVISAYAEKTQRGAYGSTTGLSKIY